MSTKYIEHCIRGWGTDDECAQEALVELEAIRKAARIIEENINVPAIPSEVEPALRLMESIAKEDAHGR